jgi:hypothetical protein
MGVSKGGGSVSGGQSARASAAFSSPSKRGQSSGSTLRAVQAKQKGVNAKKRSSGGNRAAKKRKS